MEFHFRYFWKSFQKDNNIFLDLLSNFKSVKIQRIEVHSVFVKWRKVYVLLMYLMIRLYKLRDKLISRRGIYIWYSGERIDPPTKYDLTLSFNKDTETNIYWPLWATYLDVTNTGKKYDREFIFNQQELLTPREVQINSSRSWKICAFISNDVTWRSEIITRLKEAGCIDVFGATNQLTVDFKYNYAKNYVFQLCFENELSEGYVTEKPIEAWLCGNIPIYAGGDTFGYLNKSAMIDCSRMPLGEIANHILKEIALRKENYSRINQPILSQEYNFNRFKHFINRV